LAARGDDLVAVAHAESGLDVTPRLFDVELPRTLDQLRQAAAAAREGTWRMGMIDSTRNIRSAAFGLGPVVVFPPANFPLAYGAVTGGDFAAAIAGGNPVIAKAHPGNPGVSRLAAEEAVAAVHDTELPPATVQLLHGISLEDGERLVADSRVGGTGFTGGQEAGKRLYAAAAATGRVIWVEMGSINPVVLLPGALAERGSEIAGELTASVTGSAGQFCTKPGLVFLIDDKATATFARVVAERFNAIGAQVLLGPVGRDRLVAAIAHLEKAGARVLAGSGDGPCSHRPTLLEVPAAFLVARPQALLIEAFGNATVLVRCASVGELLAALACVPGALAASVYSSREGRDDAIVGPVAASLVARAGRIIENRMPTGLAVTPPMQHGGPWPSAGPPFFSMAGHRTGCLSVCGTKFPRASRGGLSTRHGPAASSGTAATGRARGVSAVVAVAELPDPLGRPDRLDLHLFADDTGPVLVHRDARQAAGPGDRDHARGDQRRHQHEQESRAPAGLRHLLHRGREWQRGGGQSDHLLGVGFLAAFACHDLLLTKREPNLLPCRQGRIGLSGR
jgi:NADP-dependent aldehyde dehydrogenase